MALDNLLQLNSPEVKRLMKEDYLPVIEYQGFKDAGALSEAFGALNIGSTVNAPTGKKTAYIKRANTFGAVTTMEDGLTFHKASKRHVGDEFEVHTKFFQANAAIPVIEARRLATTFALEDILDGQMESVQEDLKNYFSRQLYGDGSGVITTVTAAVTVPAAGADTVVIPVKDVRLFEEGQIISFDKITSSVFKRTPLGLSTQVGYNSAKQPNGVTQQTTDGTIKSNNADMRLAGFKIVDKDPIAGTITINLTPDAYGEGAKFAALTVGDKITYNGVKPEVVGAGVSYRPELSGLKYIVRRDGEYFGLRNWKKQPYDAEFQHNPVFQQRPGYLKSITMNVANALTEEVFMDVYDALEQKNANPSFLVTSRATRRAIATTVVPGIQNVVIMRDSSAQANGDQRSLGGYKGVDINGQSINVDIKAPKGDLWILDLAEFDIAKEMDFQWDDMDGSIWKQQMDENANRIYAYEAHAVTGLEVFSTRPDAHARITIEKPTVFTQSDVDLTSKTRDAKEIGENGSFITAGKTDASGIGTDPGAKN